MRRVPDLFRRGQLTDVLLGHFISAFIATDNSLQILIGDGEAPEAGGWPKGEASLGTFVPYVALLTGDATPRDPHEAGTTESRGWSAAYQFHSVGESRQQCDWVADRVRAAWLEVPRGDIWGTEAEPSNWRLRLAEMNRLGAVVRNSQVQPYIWECTDAGFVTVQG